MTYDKLKRVCSSESMDVTYQNISNPVDGIKLRKEIKSAAKAKGVLACNLGVTDSSYDMDSKVGSLAKTVAELSLPQYESLLKNLKVVISETEFGDMLGVYKENEAIKKIENVSWDSILSNEKKQIKFSEKDAKELPTEWVDNAYFVRWSGAKSQSSDMTHINYYTKNSEGNFEKTRISNLMLNCPAVQGINFGNLEDKDGREIYLNELFEGAPHEKAYYVSSTLGANRIINNSRYSNGTTINGSIVMGEKDFEKIKSEIIQNPLKAMNLSLVTYGVSEKNNDFLNFFEEVTYSTNIRVENRTTLVEDDALLKK